MTIFPLFVGVKTGRLLYDLYDRHVYFIRGAWIIESGPAISEYPQVITFLFGINRFLFSGIDVDLQPVLFAAFFSLQMIMILFLVFKGLLEYLPPSFRNYAYLFLLPPAVYFSYNRFDILPAYLCLIAYLASAKKQWAMAGFVLAIATFTKWYPVLLFPAFFMYAKTIEAKFQWKMVSTFAVTSFAIVSFTYLLGGMETVLAPYQFHTSRSMELVSLPVLLDKASFNLLSIHINMPVIFTLFFILQIAAPVLVLILKLDTLEQLINYCIVAIGLFIFFARIWSPQWFLWLLPFLVLSAKNMKTVGLIAVYSTISYINFPFLLEYTGWDSAPLQASSMLTYVILGVIIVRAFKNLVFRKPLLFLKNDPSPIGIETV